MKKGLLYIVLLSMLGGCAAFNNANDLVPQATERSFDRLVLNVTTPSELMSDMGFPKKQQQMGNATIYYYEINVPFSTPFNPDPIARLTFKHGVLVKKEKIPDGQAAYLN